MGILDYLRKKFHSKREDFKKEVSKADETAEKKHLSEAQVISNRMHIRRKHTTIARCRDGRYAVLFHDSSGFKCSKQLALTYTVNPFRLYK